LVNEGFQILVLDNLVYGHREFVADLKFVHGDLTDTRLLESLFATHEIEGVVHFAAYAYVGESVTDPAKYYQNNVGSTLNLLTAMLAAGVKTIIFSSTCATYGNPHRIPITEDHPQDPINPYGASKVMVERILRDFGAAYGLKSVIFRYFNAAGADPAADIGEWHDPETHLIPLVLDVASGKREYIQIFGTDYDTPDGTCIRDYIHVSDLANAHVLGLRYLLSGQPSVALNLGNGKGFSVKEVIQCAERLTGKPVQWVGSPRRLGDPPILVGSATRAKELLGWKPAFESLETILSTAWKWHCRPQARLTRE
jgi:UDP-glucose 4-epimerase